jgi:hypothetical protein
VTPALIDRTLAGRAGARAPAPSAGRCRGRQLRAEHVQAGLRVGPLGQDGVGPVRAEHDLPGVDDLQRRRQRSVVVGLRGVEEEAPEEGERVAAHLRRQVGLARDERAQPVGEERDRAAAVGEVPADPRVPAERAGVQERDDGPRRLEGVLEQPAREAAERRRGRIGRVQEHVGAATVELLEHRRERRVTGVAPADVGQQHDPVEPDDVERVRELLERGVHVGQGQERERGEAARVLLDEPRVVLVDESREAARGLPLGEVQARWREGDDRELDLVAVHLREVRGRRELRHRVRRSRRLPVGVEEPRRDLMCVGVDPHAVVGARVGDGL